MAEPSPNKHLTRGRIRLLLTQPFFGVQIAKMGAVERDDIPTMATDGTRLFFSPTFVERISEAEVLGVLCHEVLHIAYGHHLRRGTRDPRLWNVACDYAVNLIVVEAGMSLPAGALLCWNFQGLSAESIYDLLLQQVKEDSGKAVPEDDDWEIGAVLDMANADGTPLSTYERTAALHENEISISLAAAAALAKGCLPGELHRLINETAGGHVRWDEELKQTFASTLATDYTWSRPNRRHIGAGLYLPGMVSQGAGEVVIGVDSSGSITGPLIDAFWAVVDDIVAQANPQRVHIVWCDCKVQHVQTFEQGEQLSPEARGGGGTDFRPVFDWVDEEGIVPQALIYLTDMEGRFPLEAPAYPTIWVKTTDVEAPFGSEIRIDVEA